MRALVRAGRLPIAVLVATLVVAGGVALAAVGDLTPQGCIADVGDLAGCGTTQQGLDAAVGVAASSDGRSVYAASAGDNAIARFDRDPATGVLTPQGCIADPPNTAGCGATQQGLGNARGVAVSPDGKSVYVTGETDRAIVRFDRDPATGALTPQGCIADPPNTAGCGATEQGLYGAFGLAVSADGKSVYATSRSDGAIVRFDRDTATGALTGRGCIEDPPVFAGCATTQQGLDAADDVAISADGNSVYVVSDGDNAIVRFDRDPATGALTPRGCISDVGDPAGCGVTQQGLRAAFGVAVSPDGSSAYAVSLDDDAIASFGRDTATGALTPQGCIADVGDTAGCGATAQGLAGATAVAVSADGSSAYVASAEDAIVRFDRDTANGALTPQGCIADVGDTAGCGATQQGLNTANRVAVSSDGNSVYVSSGTDDAIVRFDREIFVPPPPPADPTPPSNAFAVGALNGKKVELTVPGPGLVDVRDANAAKKKLLLKPSSATASAAGTVAVALKLNKAAKKTLKEKHKVKVKAAITFTPTGGTAYTQDRSFKVRKPKD